MNIYGRTKCPNCGTSHMMFRNLETCKAFPIWDEVKCINCDLEYKHTQAKQSDEIELIKIKG